MKKKKITKDEKLINAYNLMPSDKVMREVFDSLLGKGNKKQETAPELVNAQERIAKVCDNLKKFLIEKNVRYGNSALEPVRIFSKADTVEQLYVRMDDKLSRIKNRVDTNIRKNDILDLLGYAVLLCVSQNYTSFDEFLD